MTSIPDLRLWPCTWSSPCHTANYNPALSCHHHTPFEGFNPSRCQWECHWCPHGYTVRVHRNRRATGGVEPGVQLSSCQYSYSSLHRQVSRLPRGSLPYVDCFPTGSWVSSFVLERHLIIPVRYPLVSALRPLPYGCTTISPSGPPLWHSPARSPMTSWGDRTDWRHIHQ